MTAEFSGIVLAGGLSTRLGTDKALLDFGGRTLLEITVERLSEITLDVVVACGEGRRPNWPDVEARYVPDRQCRRGPLAGLEAGLNVIANDAAVVVACDMPFLNPNLLRYMASLMDDHDAVVPVVGGRRHALHGAYSRSCLRVIDDLLLQGGSMRDLLHRVDTVDIPEDAVEIMDPAGVSCFNLNSPDDLQWAREAWAGEILHR